MGSTAGTSDSEAGGGFQQRQFNALSFIRDIAAQLHDTETSEKAAAEIAELHLSAEEQLSDLSGILLGYITDRL